MRVLGEAGKVSRPITRFSIDKRYSCYSARVAEDQLPGPDPDLRDLRVAVVENPQTGRVGCISWDLLLHYSFPRSGPIGSTVLDPSFTFSKFNMPASNSYQEATRAPGSESKREGPQDDHKHGHIPLREALDMSCLETGLEFEVDGNALRPEELDAGFGDDDDIDFDSTQDGFDTNPEVVPSTLPTMNQLKTAFPECSPIPTVPEIYKQVLEEGTGCVCPSGADVKIHYEGYFDRSLKPFDSTHTLKQPKTKDFRLGEGHVIYGLDIAVGTMKVNEFSRFLIPYTHAFGEQGCYPTVPECANVVFEVRLVHFLDLSDLREFRRSTTPAAVRHVDRATLVARANDEKTVGNEHLANNRTQQARKAYNRGLDLLKALKDLPEIEMQSVQSMRLALYLNLAHACMRTDRPNVPNYEKALVAAESALAIDPDNAKGLYRAGMANIGLKRPGAARGHLQRAQTLEPKNSYVRSALEKLAELEKEEKEREKAAYTALFKKE